MRKTRFFQKNAYVSVDFLNRSHEYIRLDSNKIPKENSSFQNTKTIPEESVMIQTQSQCIDGEITPCRVRLFR